MLFATNRFFFAKNIKAFKELSVHELTSSFPTRVMQAKRVCFINVFKTFCEISALYSKANVITILK